MSLECIFNENNIDYKRIKFIIFTLPKCGTVTIIDSIKYQINRLNCNNMYKIFAFHSIIELINIDKRFQQYTTYDVIKFIECNSTYQRVYIISSYRIPEERYISCYYHNNNVYNLDRNLNEIIDIKSFLLFKDNNFNEVFVKQYIKLFKLNFDKYKYDKENGLCFIHYTKKLKWLFTSLHDIEKFINNLYKIDGLFNNMCMIVSNINTNIKYINIQHIIKFDQQSINMMRKEEAIVLIFYKI